MTTTKLPSSFDAVVLGAGISGLVSASILVDQGAGNVLVVDEYPHVGGNHIDRTHGPYTFDVGSLIFQDDSPLLRHFPELLPRYLPILPTWSRLNPQGKVSEYPFSIKDDLLAAGGVECARILASAAAARIRRRPLRHALDFGQHWIGPRLMRRSGLESYMERFFGRPADMIDLKFAEKRMLWISEHASVANLWRRVIQLIPGRQVGGGSTNQQLARPREGFAHLYQPAVERLQNSGVTFRLGAQLSALRRSDTGYVLEADGHTFDAGRVISTIPIERALKLCGISGHERLATVTLISLFFSFAGDRGFAESILYNFSHHGAWKRLTVYSDFYGWTDGREFFAVEVIGDQVECSVDRAADDFRTHTAQNRLFLGDLRLEGSFVLTEAYPIYTEGAAARAEQAIAALRDFGLESFGRQGGFQYQPTARVSTLEAEAALARPDQPG
jgi:phytoene dehydrogenase-like protein